MNQNTTSQTTRRKLWIISMVIIIVTLLLASLFFVRRDSGQNQTPQKSAEATALAINPCNLLSDSERATLGVGAGEENDRRDKGEGLAYRKCDWRSKTLQIEATIFSSGSLKTALTWENVTPEPLTIGSHKAQAALAPLDDISQTLGVRTCQLDIQLDRAGDTARVRLIINIPDDLSAQSCEIAKRVATFVETRLP